MAISFDTLALAKKYTKDTVIGLGAIKGANCTVSNSSTTTGGTNVTFRWEGTDGTIQTRTIFVKDGVSITNASIDANNHLILTLSDGNTIDAGEIPMIDNAEDITYSNAEMPNIDNVKDALDYLKENQIESAEDVAYTNTTYPTLDNVKKALDSALSSGAKLEQSLTVSNPVGSATSGKTYPKDTKLEAVLRDILIKEVAPSLTLAIVPENTLYDVVETVVSAITVKATCTKNTYNLSKVEFYLDNVLKHTQNISANGTYTYDMIWDIPTNTDFTLKAIVYDSKSGTPMSTTKSITVKFVGKSYYGFVADNIGIPTESQVKALQNNVLKDTKNLKYSNITFDYNKVVYAYPASFGNLTSIKDEIGNFDYTSSFSKQNLTIDSIPYVLYIQNDASASDSVELTFK